MIARLRPALRPGVALALLVVLAALAWAFFATPPRWELTEDGLVYGAGQLERRFGMTVGYVFIGAVAGLLWGAWAARTLARAFGPAVVVVYLVLLTGAAVAVEYLGGLLGPADPAELDLSGLRLGQTVPDPVTLDHPVCWLIWPFAGLLALVLVVYWTSEPAWTEELFSGYNDG